MRAEVIVSSDGKRTYVVDNIAQVDQALSEVARLLRTLARHDGGSLRMHLGWDADALLDRRWYLALMARRDGFELTGNVSR